jgi:hypothetical protein
MGFGRSGGSVGAFGPVQPFEFATYRSPGAIAKATTILFSTAQAEHSLAIPVGRLARLRAGKVFQFTAGGIMSTGDVGGTLRISPFYGAGTSISLGTSPEQTYVPGLVKVPWRIVGEIVFLSVSQLASSSTVWCTGEFMSASDPSMEGSGLSIPFGSSNAVTVDSKGPISTTSGALNISATFASRQLSASISAQYGFVRGL